MSANQRLTTPNKFWEAVVAGTPLVVVAGLTTMETLVREHDLGAVAASRRARGPRGGDHAVLDRLAAPEAIGLASPDRAPRRRSRFGWPPAATAYRSLVTGADAGRATASIVVQHGG